jgi:hypothetical protein
MAKLSQEHKRMIVQRLATFVAPSDIVAEFKEMGITVSTSQVVYYDPASKGTELAAEWRTLHAETRSAFVKDTSQIAIAQKSYRLRELDDMQRQAKRKKNFPLAAQLLEQAAKEIGEAYTNRRVLEAADPAAALAAMLGVAPEAITAAVAGVGAGAE